MKLYTVQGLDHWRKAVVGGTLSGGTSLDHVDPAWHRAYDWMRGQMKDRLPSTSGDYPVWAWPWDHYTMRFKPDDRWGAVGDEMVALGFEVPDARVLVSDFMAWHQVLNDDIISSAEVFTEAEKVASWDRIFHPESLKKWIDGQSPQVCVDRVFASEVFHVRPFTVEPMNWDEG